MLATAAVAQTPPQRDDDNPRPRPRGIPVPDIFRGLTPNGATADLHRRLRELDELISLGSLGRAESLLEELAAHSVLADDLALRRIRLARLRGDHAEAARLTREALVGRPASASLWRDLMESLVALDETGPARAAADSFMTRSPNRRSAAVVVAEQFLRGGRPRLAVALIDSLRPVLGEPRLLARQRAVGLLTLGEQEPAADEVIAELESFAYNYALIRTALLDGPYRPALHRDFKERLRARALRQDAPPEASLLAVDLALMEADTGQARKLAERLQPTPAGRRALLRGAMTLAQELRLLDTPDQRQATVAYLLPVLEALADVREADVGPRRRAAELIPGVCSDALLLDALGDDPRRAVERCDEMLAIVRRELPGSPQLHAARIQLALYTRDEVGAPADAAGQLERMLLDLNLPTEGVALVRLTLGECYFAAGDTSRGRTVLTRLGRDREQRRAAGHAHYHLARLDLAEGHFTTARDRFAAVALDNPGAPYANDALELGLAVAEELENPTGGPQVLGLYAPAVYHDLTGDREARRRALRDFVDAAAVLVDPRETQHLLERGRWELANLAVADGDTALALDLLDTVTAEHAEGRYPAAALAETARLAAAAGRWDRAREVLERLLAQYPEYLFADDIRDRLRSLP